MDMDALMRKSEYKILYQAYQRKKDDFYFENMHAARVKEKNAQWNSVEVYL